MSLFKGFIRTNGKQAIESFKDKKNLKSLEDVSEELSYAGVLSEDTILIDIDDKKQSDILLKVIEDKNIKCLAYETQRGKHFLFKNRTIKKCSTGSKLVLGLSADIKVGKVNSYEVLKLDGKKRKVIRDFDEYDELPFWLNPIKTNIEFFDLDDGDGRNSALFAYILPLQSSGYNINEIKEICHLINDYVFDVPLSEDELELILRDDAFSKDLFFEKNKFLFDKFSRYLISTEHIIAINNQLHIYADGIYKNDIKLIEKKMIDKIPMLAKAKRAEVLAYIELLVQNYTKNAETIIAFKNCLFDVTSNETMDFNPDLVITNMIPWEYDPDAYNELADKTLDKLACNDKQVRSLLEEIIGYCFFRRNELRKAFVLTGEKANGKSTFLDLIIEILGDENVSSLDLGELGDRFKTAELFGKLANIGDDIGDEFISDTSIFKKLVTGDRINVEKKGQDPFDFNNYSKLIFSANEIPRLGRGRDSAALLSRIIIIPFNARFSKSDPDFDPFIKYKLRKPESMKYLVRVGIEGLIRVLKNNSFTTSKRVEQEIKNYEYENNPIKQFFDDYGSPENSTTKTVYNDYKGYCYNNGLNPMSHTQFSRQVKKEFDLIISNVRVDGKQFKTFVKGP